MNNHETEDDHWRYNAEDCVRTREIGESLTRTLEKLGLQEVDAFQQAMFWPILQCMNRGVRVDKKLRQEMAISLHDEIATREQWLRTVLGHPLNPRSPVQMKALFYDDLRCKPNWSTPRPGAPRTLTCDDRALEKIGHEAPLLVPLLRTIQEIRSLSVFLGTFVNAPLDVDGRMRTSYNICGTDSFRLSSSENAFGSGTNLQNVPMGGEDERGLVLPNVRKLFVPDDGFIIFDTDLSKADLRIVAWEADEKEMKAMLKEGRDPYLETAGEFHRRKILKESPEYRTFKSFSHGTHYLGTPHGLAQRLGLTIRDAERTQRWYLSKYPAIARWQEDFKRKVASRRFVENILGYRRYFFDRVDDALFRTAIAWIPQSTVALYINRIWMQIFNRFPHIQILLQVHDSLVGQFPSHRQDEALAQIRGAGNIVLPYDDPLVIPLGLKWSNKSWGECG